MSVGVNGATDRLVGTTGTTASTGTIAVWVFPFGWSSGDSTTRVVWDYITQTFPATPWHDLSFQRFSDNNIYIGWQHDTGDQRIVAADTGIFTNSTWASHIFTWDDAADDQKYYVNGVQKGTRTTAFSSASLSHVTLGNYDVLIGDANSQNFQAEWAIWNIVLPAADRAAFDKGFAPSLIRPAALIDYAPLVRDLSKRKGTALTATGTLAGAHPKLIYPRRSSVVSITPSVVSSGLMAQAVM